MKFTKMQGIGNDYVYLDCTEGEPKDLASLARQMSDRHFGIGSDGLICACASNRADFRMRMFNADGSEGEMCGNGIRCLGKFIYDKGLSDKTELTIETLAGLRTVTLHTTQGQVDSVTVDMGEPSIEPTRVLNIMDKNYTVYPISMGNPHAVVFEPGVDLLPLTELGPHFEHHHSFPNRTNTEFVEVLSRDCLKMRVWERGSGETFACGTGACAVLVASVLSGQAERMATVRLLGGELSIRWDEQDNHVYMTGPAVTVFEGEWQEA